MTDSMSNILVECGWDMSVGVEGIGRTAMGAWSSFRWRATATRNNETLTALGVTLGEAIRALYHRVGLVHSLPEAPK